MVKLPKRPADANRLAVSIVEQAIGEKIDGKPLPELPDESAVARGILGGPARAAALAPSERKAIAKRVANARWSGKPVQKD
jgi:hypothetical protein